MTEKEKREKAYAEEWRRRMHGVKAEATAVCANCEHFRRHYVIIEEDLVRVASTPWGHCTSLRVESRKETDYCERFKVVATPSLPRSYEFDSLQPFLSRFWRMKEGPAGPGRG